MKTMMLDCRLTDEDKIERGAGLAALVQEIKSLEEEKALVGKEFKERIDFKAFDARHLAKVIKQGFEERAVSVVEETDYTRRTIQIIRTDTGEVVSTRQMGIDDAQEEMSFDEDRHKGKITMLGGNN